VYRKNDGDDDADEDDEADDDGEHGFTKNVPSSHLRVLLLSFTCVQWLDHIYHSESERARSGCENNALPWVR